MNEVACLWMMLGRLLCSLFYLVAGVTQSLHQSILSQAHGGMPRKRVVCLSSRLLGEQYDALGRPFISPTTTSAWQQHNIHLNTEQHPRGPRQGYLLYTHDYRRSAQQHLTPDY